MAGKGRARSTTDPAPGQASSADRAASAGPPDAVGVPDVLAGRFPVIDVSPVVEGGRRPAKAVVGEVVPVEATAFREGHHALGVEVALHDPRGRLRSRTRMDPVGQGLDRWRGLVVPDAEGVWTFVIETWDDPWATWCHRAAIKVPAGQDIERELEEGALLLERIARALPRGRTAERTHLRQAVVTVRRESLPPSVRLAAALDPEVAAIVEAHPIRVGTTATGPWPLLVERRRALVGSWYEFFPRSEGAVPPRSGTLRTAAERLPAIAAMGFDVVYLPPIHPIGRTFRKGANNSLEAGPDDPGSPWAIGSADGGHDAVHPELGTLEDLRAFIRRADGLGLEIALDLALQASPDHPWVHEHPEWFTRRWDGTIAHAENPPKKYQDIYPLDFDNDPEGLYAEVLRIVRHWMEQGIRIFRVDNPHTKPLWVWDRLLADIRSTDPDVMFLAEAFTRPPMMRALAEVGFQQGYTYFTWRNDKAGLEEYFGELAGPASAYLRPNAFVNTPDILTEYLQQGGPAAFAIRATLAATLSPTWGVYSGFELFEHVAARPGSEEYLDSEKFQLRPRDWDGDAPTLAPYIALLNRVRREHPALQDLRSLRFHRTEDDAVIAFSKRVPRGPLGTPDADAATDADDIVLVVCLLDPRSPRETLVWWDLAALGMRETDRFSVHDAVTDSIWTWQQPTYVRLDPQGAVAHVARVRPAGA